MTYNLWPHRDALRALPIGSEVTEIGPLGPVRVARVRERREDGGIVLEDFSLWYDTGQSYDYHAGGQIRPTEPGDVDKIEASALRTRIYDIVAGSSRRRLDALDLAALREVEAFLRAKMVPPDPNVEWYQKRLRGEV